MPDKLWHKRGARVKLPKISKVLLFPCLISSLFSKHRSLQLHETSKQRNPCYFMHIIYTYHHHQRWISNECDYTNVPTIISNSKTIRVKKIYFYTENKRKERNCWTRFLFYPRANSRMITRWSRERRLARNEIQPPTTFACGRKRKKKGREGEGDRDESIRARRETETVNYRTGTRQSREPVGRTSSRINRAKSIVRYYYTRWKGWTVERKKEKEKKKGDARDKKNRFPARNQTIHRVSIPRTLWRNEQQDPVDRQKIVARFPLFYLWRRSDAFSKPV